MLRVMSRDDLQVITPSVFADNPYHKTSEAYKQYPTIDVVDKLGKEGWLPVYACEQSARSEERKGFQKHIIRFRHERDIPNILSGKMSEGFDIVLTNSHDGSSSYNLSAGVFRVVCINGMIVGAEAFSVRVRHMGNTPADVLRESMNITKQIPAVQERVEKMKGRLLNSGEVMDFSDRAYDLKWPRKAEVESREYAEDEVKPIYFEPLELARPRRFEDTSNDAWSVFNRIQENIIKGSAYRVSSNRGRRRVRGTNSISENVRLNKELWNIAESFIN